MTRLDRWISEETRTQIEQHFYARINSQARFESLSRDPYFMEKLSSHVGLFADHGVVHMRDVVEQTVKVLDQVHGLLIPERSPRRLEWMQGYGVLVACLHDVGMTNFSLWGRLMHPEFAAQLVFDPEHDDIVDALWTENSGNVAWRLVRLQEQGILAQEPQQVLRELLAMSLCHSKTKVPVEILNDPLALRETLVQVVSTDLDCLYQCQQAERLRQALEQPGPTADEGTLRQQLAEVETTIQNLEARSSCLNPHLERFYQDAAPGMLPGAFTWLADSHPALQQLVVDVQDTLRVLRCADALRQRGTTLKTSGGYEVFVDQQTAQAVYALRLGSDRLYLLRLPALVSCGEANLASSELDPHGDMRVSFHRGRFATDEATRFAARAAAYVIWDIKLDIVNSFRRPQPAHSPEIKQSQEMQILLESQPDNPQFAHMVRDRLLTFDPEVTVKVVPGLQLATDEERERYLDGRPVEWDLETRRQFLARMGRAGHPVADLNPQEVFEHTRLIQLDAGERLLEAGATSSFVYVPLGPGLQIIPLGGYQSFSVEPWMPLGLTGVIRGATRNATVLAERQVPLLAIPRSVYLERWHQTYDAEIFRRVIARTTALEETPATLNRLERANLMQSVPLFAALDQDMLLALADEMAEEIVEAGETLFVKGDVGDCMYIIASGRMRVHDGPHTLTHLGVGDVFGELAALSPEARMASVTALEQSRLLALDSASLQQLFAGQSHVAWGVLQVVTRQLQERVQDLVRLRRQTAGSEEDE